MWRRFAGLAIVVGLISMFVPPGVSREKPDVSAFMRAKLNHSQKILEGLTIEDYQQIASNANTLAALSQETDWNVIQTEEYRDQSREFRRRALALSEAAEGENLDGATLAFVQVTMSCVECHKLVRQINQ